MVNLGHGILKFGDRGRRVKQLQHYLVSLGYEVGPLDGRFGYLTEEAVQLFQKDYRLKPDGVVGPETLQMLAKGIPERFKIHIVTKSQSLRSIAQFYALSISVLAKLNRLSDYRVTPGQRLRVPKRLLMGAVTLEGIQPTESLFRHSSRLNGVIAKGFTLNGQGDLRGELFLAQDLREWLRKHSIPLWLGVDLPPERSELERLLFRRKFLNRGLQEIARQARLLGAKGVLINFSSASLYRHRHLLNRLSKLAVKVLGSMTLAISLPLPEGAAAGVYDYSYLAKHAEFLLCCADGETQDLGRAIRTGLKEIPCWKMILSLAGGKTTRQLKEQVGYINEYNMGGACIVGLGREGDSIWGHLREEFLSGEINVELPASGVNIL